MRIWEYSDTQTHTETGRTVHAHTYMHTHMHAHTLWHSRRLEEALRVHGRIFKHIYMSLMSV